MNPITIPPTITAIPNQTVDEDNTLAPVLLSLANFDGSTPLQITSTNAKPDFPAAAGSWNRNQQNLEYHPFGKSVWNSPIDGDA